MVGKLKTSSADLLIPLEQFSEPFNASKNEHISKRVNPKKLVHV